MAAPSSPPKSTEPLELKGGRYSLLGTLGEGAQGETYEAIDNGAVPPKPSATLKQDWDRYVRRAREGDGPAQSAARVAIKCFRVGRAKAWKDVELAEREARTLASLDHPRLPKYIEHFEENGSLYLVMEKVEGESLAKLRSRRAPMSVAEVTRMLEDIADALRYLHGRAPPIVHRDIKPGNILRRPDGSFALVDFGAVRDHLKPGGGSTVVGTFGYMAPEQFQGRAFPRSDLYGLGATALAMLTGIEPEQLPHAGLGIDVARALPAGTPARLVRTLDAMLAPDPDRRVATIDEAMALLRESPPPAHREQAELPPLTKKQKRELKHRRKHAEREERRRRRAIARTRRAPFVPRLVAKLGLLVARLAVWLAVGVVVPLVLMILSLVFGKAMRQAASACVRASKRSQAALGRASDWLSGHRPGDESLADAEHPEVARTRVASPGEIGFARVRAVSEHEQAGARIETEAWVDEQLAREAEADEADDSGRRRHVR